MASSASATNSRLSVNDWVQEGFRVLAEDGVKSLTLGHLCGRLRVTKGSFYWHFSDMTAYRAALIDTWAVVRDEDRSFERTGESASAGAAVADDDHAGGSAALDAGARHAGMGTVRANRGRRGAGVRP